MSCKPFKTSEANAKAYLKTKGAIDEFLNIKDLNTFRKENRNLKDQAKEKYFYNIEGWNEKLFYEEDNGKKAVPNIKVFKEIDAIIAMRNAINKKEEPEKLKKEKERLEKEASLVQMKDAKRAGVPYTDEYLFNKAETSGKKTIGEVAKETYFKDSDTRKALDVINEISNSDHPLNKLAKRLLPYVKANNVNISLTNDVREFKSITNEKLTSAAYYLPSSNEIKIVTSGKGNLEKVILHEVLHSISAWQLSENTETNIDFNKLFQHAKEKLPHSYELENIDEFLVGIFTDSKFIKALQKLPAIEIKKYKNFFEEVLDHLLSYLGLKKGTSLYEQAFDIATNILEESKQFSELINQSEEYNKYRKEEDYLLYSPEEKTKKDVVSSAIENQIDELIRKGIIKAKCD